MKQSFLILFLAGVFSISAPLLCAKKKLANNVATKKKEPPKEVSTKGEPAQGNPSSGIKINLSLAIKRMLNYNGEMLGERKDIDFAQGRMDQANAGWFPKSELILLSAPIYEERGNALQSTGNLSKWGFFGNAILKVVQPLHTFGMISGYKKAAAHGYEVEAQRVRAKEEELIYRLKQFYYGYQLANDLLDIVQEAKEKMDDAIKKAEEMLERNKIKREDLFALKTYYAIVMSKHDEAARGKYLAGKALAWTLAYPLETELQLEDAYLFPEEVNLKGETDYLISTEDNRPELKMLYSGIEATKYLWEARAKEKMPVFFLLGFANGAYSNVREKQKSVFANDPFNTYGGGVAFGLRFNLDWWTINSMSKQSKAEYEKLLSQKETLHDGMMLQVKKAYREAVDYKNNIEYTKDGEKYASKWFMNATIGYGMGFDKVDGLIDAMKAYFEAKVNYCMAIYNYNMALADLTKVTGKEVVPSVKY